MEGVTREPKSGQQQSGATGLAAVVLGGTLKAVVSIGKQQEGATMV